MGAKENKLRFEIIAKQDTKSVADRNCLKIRINGKTAIKVSPDEKLHEFIVLDQSVERKADKFFARVGEQPISFSIPEDQLENLGIMFNHEQGLIRIVVEDNGYNGEESELRASRGQYWDIVIPVKSSWSVRFQTEAYEKSSVSWIANRMWYNIPF